MVEGKVSESFLDNLNLEISRIMDVRYQLLHRTVSAIIEAEKINASHALMLIHSFSLTYEWFEDYAQYVHLFGLQAEKDKIIGPVQLNGIDLYFGWVTGHRKI